MKLARRLSSSSSSISFSFPSSLDLLNLSELKKFQSGGIKANNKSRRAYENVSVIPVDHGNNQNIGFCVGMDDKILVTPSKNLVEIDF